MVEGVELMGINVDDACLSESLSPPPPPPPLSLLLPSLSLPPSPSPAASLSRSYLLHCIHKSQIMNFMLVLIALPFKTEDED